jgi:hypothetical protein
VVGRVSFEFSLAHLHFPGYVSHMKHYILLSVEIPPQTENAQYSKWLNLEQRLAPLAKTTKGIVQLGEGVWLLPRDQGMIFASECIAVARSNSLKAQARFLSEDDEPSS